MRQDEQDLADTARVLAGDAGAFQGIVERWQFRLVNLAWRFTRDRATAEDMAQEVFIKVFRSFGQLPRRIGFLHMDHGRGGEHLSLTHPHSRAASYNAASSDCRW